MPFSSLVASMDATLLSVLNDDPTVTLHFQDSTPDISLPYITKNPTWEEDYQPGSPASTGQGVTVMILFVHLTPAQIAAARFPREGDTASISGVDYDIGRVGADREDGRTLYLRRRNQRFDR